MRLKYSLSALCLSVLLPISLHAQRSEIGTIFTSPNGYLWQDAGAIVNTKEFFGSTSLNPNSLKIIHTRFHLFKPSDDYTWNWFPYSALRSYEASEVAAGRPPIFVTATYQGKKRPVVWNWSLGLQGSDFGVPRTPTSRWEYAVNVRDDRFINFWINQYVRNILYRNLGGLQNLWIGLDECAFIPALYGVIDDAGNFISGVRWDPPFAQNETEYLDSIRYFFARVKQLAPDLKLMPNSGGLSNWSRFWDIFGTAQGLMVEEIHPFQDALNSGVTAYIRNKQFDLMTAYFAASAQNHPMIFQTHLPPNDMRWNLASYAMYGLLRGNSTYYAPTIAGTHYALPPSYYSAIQTALGNPVGPLQSQHNASFPTYWPGYRLYWRQFANGILYLNWSGATQTIVLPAGRQHYEANGSPVSRITVPDLTASFVLFDNLGLTR